MKKLLQTLVLTAFVALAAPAWALGLGQLKLKSGQGQPLLAEIPVITAEPAELERLQARLASPETFLRVGLPLPDSLVSDLQFSLVRDAEGKPVIRVTSPEPVSIPMLTFLLEVDWGEGRLVREYSVLVAAPESVAAAAVPEIEAAEGAPSNTIVRDAEAASNQAPLPEANTTATANASSEAAAPVATVASSAIAAPVNNAAVTAPASAAGQTLPAVQRGQTLSGIAAAMKQPGQDLQTIMAALLLANPEAFINGNPHRLREGAVLQLPAGDAASGGFASAEVKAMAAQLSQWRARSGRRGRAVDVASGVSDASGARGNQSNTANTRRSARLEIAPAATSAAAAASLSGTGGKGDSLMAQQLQEAQETIAARDAEVAELKLRVAELEKLKEQQNQLIQMKDGELAQVQQQLKAQNAGRSDAAGGQALLWSALAVLLLAGIVFAAWLLRQRKQAAWDAAIKRGAGAASERQAPSFSEDFAQAYDADRSEQEAGIGQLADSDKAASLQAEEDSPQDLAFAAPQSSAVEADAKAAQQTVNTLWHLPSWVGSASHEWEKSGDDHDAVALKPLTDDPAKVGAWTFPADAGEPRAEGFASQAQPVLPDAVPAVPVADELPANVSIARPVASATSTAEFEDGRLMLARTYIELGDYGTARLLLQQIVDEGEVVQAARAQQLLNELD
ncbi:fimbrial protein FimV [Lysobacteraceae bacterium NML07-0707]|nr:fimbrial protein FimV [Xanthomonadaceae bacterium NML07-0707]